MLLYILIIFVACFNISHSINQGIYSSKLVFQHASTVSFYPRFSGIVMSDRRGSPGGGGSTKLDKKIAKKTELMPNLKDEIEKDWRLILHDDNIHTIQEVCDILSLNCPLCAGPRAYEVTLEVHMTGAGTVAVANKKIIDEYTKSLQIAGLTVSMAPDEEFE